MGLDYVIVDLGAAVGAEVESVRRRGDALATPGTLSISQIRVSRGRGASTADLTVSSIADREVAAEAARDPRKIVAPVMPVSLIRPISPEDFGLDEPDANVTAARAAGASWGVADVLGPAPKDLDGIGVTVAVLDSGIDPVHNAFKGVRAGIIARRKNFTSDGDDDEHGHGTHCAGTIFGRDVQDGGRAVRIGIARGVNDILIGKVLGDDGGGSTKGILDGLKWAHEEGANIVSMSLGYDFPSLQKGLMDAGYPPELATSTALKAYRDSFVQFQKLAEFLMARSEDHPGMVIVAAAGNESRRDRSADFVIDVSVPAVVTQEIVSVGASRMTANGYAIADFSNIRPVVSAPGVGIVSARTGGGLVGMNGTSMACPHVADVAALWWQHFAGRDGPSNVRAEDVAAQVRATARAEKFVPSLPLEDRGNGVVLAPQR